MGGQSSVNGNKNAGGEGAMSDFHNIRYPVYFMKGDLVEVDGNFYVMPEAMACSTPKDLIVYIYEKGLKPSGYLHQ